MIHIFYMTKVNIGGWATFTRHLIDALKDQGHEVQLWRIGNNTEQFQRPFGPDGHTYRNIAAMGLCEFRDEPTIIAALGKHFIAEAEQLIGMGAGVVIHDTAESTNRMALHKPWVIRRALLGQAPGAVFIRHPYVRHAPLARKKVKREGAIATSRVDFDKNTAMILDANRLGAGIKIVGFENRLYTKFKIVPNYPEWVQSPGTHSRTGKGNYARLCAAKYMVDLTDIKGDGGGTQYTFLEAWDAGAIPVIGRWWIQTRDDMVPGTNCIAVSNADELLAAVTRKSRSDIERGGVGVMGDHQLKRHAPKVVVPQIMEWLNAR